MTPIKRFFASDTLLSCIFEQALIHYQRPLLGFDVSSSSLYSLNDKFSDLTSKVFAVSHRFRYVFSHTFSLFSSSDHNSHSLVTGSFDASGEYPDFLKHYLVCSAKEICSEAEPVARNVPSPNIKFPITSLSVGNDLDVFDSHFSAENIINLQIDCYETAPATVLKTIKPKHLSLRCVNNAQLSKIANSTFIESLDLSCNLLSNISCISSLPQLRYLDLYGTKISSLKAVEKCTNIVKLNIGNCEIVTIKSLATCNLLEEFYAQDIGSYNPFAERRPPDLKIEVLSKFFNLRIVDLSMTLVSNISPLSSCTKLEVLHLSCTKITDISALSMCLRLYELDISFTKVSDLTPLSRCISLFNLMVNKTLVEDVRPLVNCKYLSRLNLEDTSVTNPEYRKLYESADSIKSLFRNLC
ncbi:hypothetical protein RCL1_008190 [Eukaryota sp. TZLM3-RCL]